MSKRLAIYNKHMEAYETFVQGVAEGVYKIGNTYSSSLQFSKQYLGSNYSYLMKQVGKTEKQLHKDVIAAVNSYVITNLDVMVYGQKVHQINKLVLS